MHTYEAKNLQVNVIFTVVANYVAGITSGAEQEILMEAIFKAKDLRLQQILFLSSCKRLVHVSNMEKEPKWKQKIMIAYLRTYYRMG